MVEKFFEALSQVDSPAYIELPLSKEEWEKATPVKKGVVAFLYALWRAGWDIRKVYEGWFYPGYEVPSLLRIEELPGKELWVTFLWRGEKEKFELIFNEPLPFPKSVEDYADRFPSLVNELKAALLFL
ncbi:hypothetical protein Theam_1827 (plasmid) [Thermovibrio ammonificans HB-1]|uniref:Uncharacterized protein n=1 Tax=Thermovibrio ammonificans (strain DSM 15698 / JCM 12110 / HB-1) TaxID=648996 RepID=E8T6W0_THEA1|nr:hypothetical protein [Thermovibrio ammonificans]ADU97783.1 hypothetical protein Theam_1827 [Thermovibrio ammonificans HB-1]